MKSKKNKELKQLNKVAIYLRIWPFEVEDNGVFPEDRAREINGCQSKKVRGEKYYVWKLLEYAMQKEFGLDLTDAGIKKEESKWCCSHCEFSLSHADNIVAVAVSVNPVGVDIEEDSSKFEKIKDKFLHPNEKQIESVNLSQLWTNKEAIFKKSNKKAFLPQKINTLKENVYNAFVEVGSKSYSLSVASDNLNNLSLNIIEEDTKIKIKKIN